MSDDGMLKIRAVYGSAYDRIGTFHLLSPYLACFDKARMVESLLGRTIPYELLDALLAYGEPQRGYGVEALATIIGSFCPWCSGEQASDAANILGPAFKDWCAKNPRMKASPRRK